MKVEELQQTQIDHYRKRAVNFDKLYLRENNCHKRKIDLVAKYLNIQPGDTVLEVGVGTGIHARWLLEMHHDLDISFLGCDLSPDMLEKAKQRLASFSNIRLFVCPGEALSLRDSSVDKAYISGSLHHFADKRKGVEELVRVVRPGGMIVISEPNILCPANIIQVLPLLKTEYGQFQTRPKALRKFFTGLPVEIVDQRFFNFTPPFPRSYVKFFNKIDNFLGKLPVVRSISSMSLIVARRI